MFCSKCGKELKGDELFCPQCGEKVEKDILDTNYFDDISIENAPKKEREEARNETYNYNEKTNESSSKSSINSSRTRVYSSSSSSSSDDYEILGTLSIVFGILISWIGIIIGIVGLCVSQDEKTKKKCRTGIIVGCSIIAFWIVFGIIMVLAFGGAFWGIASGILQGMDNFIAL